MTSASHFLRVVAAVAFVLTCASMSTAVAQSGRRVRTTAPVPVSTPTPEPKPTPNASAQKLKADRTFVVGVERHSGFSNIPTYYYQTVLLSCANRLDDATAVRAEVVYREMTLGDAIARAKTEKVAHVVWLRLSNERMGNDPGRVESVTDIYLEFSVFAPGTGKRIVSGNAYQGARRRGVLSGPSPSGRGNSVYSDYLLKEAAREAAERILDSMRMAGRPTIP